MYWPEYGDSMTVGPYTVHNKTTVNETSSSTLTELNLVLSKEDQLVYENQVFAVMYLFKHGVYVSYSEHSVILSPFFLSFFFSSDINICFI